MTATHISNGAPSQAQQPDFTAAIIDSGFSGLGMAIRLKQQGRSDFAVFEREAGLGGAWYANTYPGCASDVPSHLAQVVASLDAQSDEQGAGFPLSVLSQQC